MPQTSREKREERKERKRQQSEDVNAILCNSVKMIREKLTVSEGRFFDLSFTLCILEKNTLPNIFMVSPLGERGWFISIFHILLFFFQNLKQKRKHWRRRDMSMTFITQVIIMEGLVICKWWAEYSFTVNSSFAYLPQYILFAPKILYELLSFFFFFGGGGGPNTTVGPSGTSWPSWLKADDQC